jgi:hypothetical protein
MSNGAPLSSGMNQGAAQVLSFPQVDRAIEFERQKKLEQMRNDNIERRRLNIKREADIEKMLTSSENMDYWKDHETLAPEMEGKQKALIEMITAKAQDIKNGDPVAQRDLALGVADLKNSAAKTLAYKERWNKSAALYLQDKSKWSDEAYQTLMDLRTGKRSFEDVMAENPTWDWPDLGKTLQEWEQEFFAKEGKNFVAKKYTDAENIGHNQLNVNTEYDTDGYAEAFDNFMTNNHIAYRDIQKQLQPQVLNGAIQEGKEKDFALSYARDLRSNMKPDAERATAPSAGGSGSGRGTKLTEQDFTRAADVKQVVSDAAESGNGRMLKDFVSSAGYNVGYDSTNDEWVFTDEKGLVDGSKVGTVTRVPRGNQQQVYEFIAKVNPNYSIEAIEAGKEPETGRFKGTAIEQMKAAPAEAKQIVGEVKAAKGDEAIASIAASLEKLGFSVTPTNNWVQDDTIKSVTKGGVTYNMSNPEDVQQFEKAVTAAKKQAIKAEEPKSNTSVPTVTSQSQYESLPAGAEYRDGQGNLRRKSK